MFFSFLGGSINHTFRATKIGFVFQLFHLLPYLTARQNVLLAARPQHLTDDSAYANELLNQFGLSNRAAHIPSQLSAGERQRVALARAMLHHPQLLLADEPTGNLDPDNAAQVMDIVKKFHSQGGTVLLVTHDPVAADYADRSIDLAASR